MDSLTQIVLGASVGELVLGRKVGNKALAYGAIAGTIPDLDVLVGNFTDTVTAIELHRGFSHSFVFPLLIAPVLGYAVSRIHPEARWQEWTKLFFWGIFTHPLLDAFTTWGTQLFWPFDYRVAFNSIFVVDPLYTLPFLAATGAAMFYRRTARKRRVLNAFGLIWSTSYLLVAVLLKALVNQQFTAALADQNISYRQISTRPSPFNTVLWYANVEVEDAYLLGDYSFFDRQPIRFTYYPKQRERFAAVRREDKLRRLVDISQGWYLITQEDARLYFNDLRFGVRPRPDGGEAFVFQYALIPSPEGLRVEETPKGVEDGRFLLKALWERLKGR